MRSGARRAAARARQPFARAIAPGDGERFAYRTCPGRLQPDTRRAPLAPAAFYRHEHFGLGADKERLLLRRQSDGPPRSVGIAECGKGSFGRFFVQPELIPDRIDERGECTHP